MKSLTYNRKREKSLNPEYGKAYWGLWETIIQLTESAPSTQKYPPPRLNLQALRVLSALILRLKKNKYYNVFSVKQKDIAKALKMDTGDVSKAFKILIEAEILIKHDNSKYHINNSLMKVGKDRDE